jgi:hypothetical protein
LLLGGKGVVQGEQSLECSVRHVIEFGVSRDVWMASEVVIDSLHENYGRVGCVRKFLDIYPLLEPSKTIEACFLDHMGWVKLKHLRSPRSAAIGSCYFHSILSMKR